MVRAGSFNHGQGHATIYAMIVADRLGLPLEAVEVVDNDTAVLPRGGNTGGSRSMQTAGNATWLSADNVAEQARLLPAELLEANPADVVLDRALGQFM